MCYSIMVPSLAYFSSLTHYTDATNIGPVVDLSKPPQFARFSIISALWMEFVPSRVSSTSLYCALGIRIPINCEVSESLCRDGTDTPYMQYKAKLIAKFLQFQPEVQQKMF